MKQTRYQPQAPEGKRFRSKQSVIAGTVVGVIGVGLVTILATRLDDLWFGLNFGAVVGGASASAFIAGFVAGVMARGSETPNGARAGAAVAAVWMVWFFVLFILPYLLLFFPYFIIGVVFTAGVSLLLLLLLATVVVLSGMLSGFLGGGSARLVRSIVNAG